MSAVRPENRDGDAWLPRRSATGLPRAGMDLWYIDLESQGPLTTHSMLSPEERERAAAMGAAEARTRFTSARVALRRILGDYLGCTPQSVPIRCRPDGKPELSAPSDMLRFNLSHARQHALVAVSYSREVGVDIECERAISNLERLARRVLTEGEARWLGEAPEMETTGRFLGLWTRKEALAKAWGAGIFRSSIREVELLPDAGESTWQTIQLPREDAKWSLRTVRPPVPGCVGAVAIEGDPVDLSTFRWRPDS